MKRVTLVLFLAIVSVSGVLAQDSTKVWKVIGENKLTVGSIALSNWSAGGENAINMMLSFDYQFNYLKEKNKWDNRFILLYGLNKQGSSDFQKTDDRIDITSNYGWEFKKHWYYSFELNFKSQFTEGYDDSDMLSSSFMAPAYLTLSPGVEYEPHDKFKANFSPLSSKFTFVYNDSLSGVGAYGVDSLQNVRYELGAYLSVNWRYDFNDNLYMEHLLRLYSNYLDKPENVDLDYTGKISLKATKFIDVNFVIQALYDDDIIITNDTGSGPRMQLKSVLGVGLVYSIDR